VQNTQPQYKLKQIFQFNGTWLDYYENHKESIRPVVVDNIVKMLSCGTNAWGYAYYTCHNPNCTHTKYVPFTCKSRFCPTCGVKATNAWILKQNAILPKTEWQHITFTMPKTLSRLFDLNRNLLNHLSRIAAKVIMYLAKTKGITLAIFTALHTFGRDLQWHPHIHLSTTRGGITDDLKKWLPLFFKKKALTKVWKHLIIRLLKTAYAQGELTLPHSLQELCPTYQSFCYWINRQYPKYWVVHCAKPSSQHWHNVNYLGRYLKKAPIAQSRLKHYDGKTVVFSFLNHRNNNHENFHCSAIEFIERFIQHIPEKGFRLIRYYGILANRVRGELLPIVYALLEQVVPEIFKLSWGALYNKTFGFHPLDCILCGTRLRLANIAVGLSIEQLRSQHKNLATMKPIVI
jgi:hypothetical protein